MIRILAILAILAFLPSQTAAEPVTAVLRSGPGQFEPVPGVYAAFAGSQAEFRFEIYGPPGTKARVMAEVFQKLSATVVPLAERRPVSDEIVLAAGKANIITAKVAIPTVERRIPLLLRFSRENPAQILATVELLAVPDEILQNPGFQPIFTTGAAEIRAAFADRDLEIAEGDAATLRTGKWRGIWFLTGDGSAGFPIKLSQNQALVLLETAESVPWTPVARQLGEGWLIKLNRRWFADFSTNAGAQLALDQLFTQLQP